MTTTHRVSHTLGALAVPFPTTGGSGVSTATLSARSHDFRRRLAGSGRRPQWSLVLNSLL